MLNNFVVNNASGANGRSHFLQSTGIVNFNTAGTRSLPFVMNDGSLDRKNINHSSSASGILVVSN